VVMPSIASTTAAAPRMSSEQDQLLEANLVAISQVSQNTTSRKQLGLNFAHCTCPVCKAIENLSFNSTATSRESQRGTNYPNKVKKMIMSYMTLYQILHPTPAFLVPILRPNSGFLRANSGFLRAQSGVRVSPGSPLPYTLGRILTLLDRIPISPGRILLVSPGGMLLCNST
jgi:hypothetical protein